jgi:tRNA/tmRNA/rRNA uracil-C5-methylase (TrmA/RlmC/RlmD family)
VDTVPNDPIDSAAGDALHPGCELRCPGCAHRRLSASDSEGRKLAWLSERLADWAERIRPLHAVGGEARWAYRDRVCLKCEWRDGAWQIGMNLGDEVIAIPDCPVHSPRVTATLHALLDSLPDADGFPLAYFVQSGAQVTLVLKTDRLPDPAWLDKHVKARLHNAGVEGLWLHLHPAVGRKIFNKPGWHLLWGQARSIDDHGLSYGPIGFQQLIPALYHRALDAAQAHLRPSADAVLIDLYSGSGATLRRWSRVACDAIGVELGAQAWECAAVNAPAATTLRGTCAQRLPQLDAWAAQSGRHDKTRLLFANPPRTGLEQAVSEWICHRYRPRRMAYLSCSAGTLHRDLSMLTADGYRVDAIIPYDFFPHTYHLETLTLLEDNGAPG